MMSKLSEGDRLTLLDCLIDYHKLLKAGLSIDCPLADERQEQIDAVGRFIDALTEAEEQASEQTHGSTSGHATAPGETSAGRVNTNEIPGTLPVDCASGTVAGDRSDRPREWVVSDSLGDEKNPSASDFRDKGDPGSGV